MVEKYKPIIEEV